jgi:hypothetical protein
LIVFEAPQPDDHELVVTIFDQSLAIVFVINYVSEGHGKGIVSSHLDLFFFDMEGLNPIFFSLFAISDCGAGYGVLFND